MQCPYGKGFKPRTISEKPDKNNCLHPEIERWGNLELTIMNEYRCRVCQLCLMSQLITATEDLKGGD